MRQIAVVSGKGGTGKTSLVASFAALGPPAVLADCDVDAANLGLVLRPALRERHSFQAAREARIDAARCRQCGLCQELCPYDAIDGFRVDPWSCEGCGVCARFCPVEAIAMEDKVSGEWFVSDTAYGPLVHARLRPGEANSGKLVTAVRRRAEELAASGRQDLVLIDGPPGIGCPVMASLTGVTRALVVTEPGLSGLHDLQRVLAVCRHFGVPTLVCVNRYDLHEGTSRAMEERCRQEEVQVAARIPYDPAFTAAVVAGRPVVECAGDETSRAIRLLWRQLLAGET